MPSSLFCILRGNLIVDLFTPITNDNSDASQFPRSVFPQPGQNQGQAGGLYDDFQD
jgi:hypothetical protein